MEHDSRRKLSGLSQARHSSIKFRDRSCTWGFGSLTALPKLCKNEGMEIEEGHKADTREGAEVRVRGSSLMVERRSSRLHVSCDLLTRSALGAFSSPLLSFRQ